MNGRRSGTARNRPPAARALRHALLAAVVAVAGLAAPVAAAESGGERAVTRLAKGKLLVASRDMADPRFAETVILIVEYDEDGALGVVVNQPTDVPLVDALPEVKELARRRDVVYLGGPVARDRMLLLLRAREQPPQSLRVLDRVYASGSLATLRDSVARGDGVRAYAGYAGWAPGQLDGEVARGDWLIGAADVEVIFAEQPAGLWRRLIERLAGDWAMALARRPRS